MAKRTKPGLKPAGKAGGVNARAYTSPTLVLLAMDWPAGSKFSDFLGFAILRTPGFNAKEKDAYLLNKVGFTAPGPNSQPLPSNIAPFQKFLWWDAGIDDKDRGKTFKYTITPVRGTSATNLVLQHDAETTLTVALPKVEEDGISTWFNRAVVSSQAFSRQFPDPHAKLPEVMDWLANGLGKSFAAILTGATEIEGAIYHLTDKRWVMPALKGLKGDLSLVYEDRKNDQTDFPAVKLLKSGRFTGRPRSKTNIMHDKFLVDTKRGRVLMGSANFTPEGLTSQANLLHIFNSPALAKLYSDRQQLIATDPTIANTAKTTGWSRTVKVGKASVRVFFSPEPTRARVSIDTVISTIKNAKSSVVFCMFDPTDPALLKALLATGDRKKLLFGLLNNISEPNAKKKKTANGADDLSDSGEAPTAPTANTEIKVTLFNRSRKDKKVLAYNYFRPGDTPAGFLPELSAVDMSSQSTLTPAKPKAGKKGKQGPPAVHIHHKFIVVDADTDNPTIYTGSANLSNNSTHKNDENLLEIKDSPALAQTYLAEFMRLYEHYRARALWNIAHGGGGKAGKRKAKAATTSTAFTLKTRRDDWVKAAYKPGAPEYIARTKLAQ
jgi:phosphatidylserine/phosphatidylglycerophosphate/cardiolipin synthase-like enzyme